MNVAFFACYYAPLRVVSNCPLVITMQTEDVEEMGRELTELVAAMGMHKRAIKKLEGLEEVCVDVTERKHQQSLELPPGQRVRLPKVELDGEVLWSPPSATEEVKVEESTEVVLVQMSLPVVHPV